MKLVISIFILMLVSSEGFALKSKVLQTKDIKINKNDLSFKYLSSDGEIILTCKHWQNTSDLNDWQIFCGKGTHLEKQYVAHVIIRKHIRNDLTESMELLYWVTDRNSENTRFSSQSQTINFKKTVDISDLTLMQSIENDYAQLVLTYKNNE